MNETGQVSYISMQISSLSLNI